METLLANLGHRHLGRQTRNRHIGVDRSRTRLGQHDLASITHRKIAVAVVGQRVRHAAVRVTARVGERNIARMGPAFRKGGGRGYINIRRIVDR